MRSERSRVATLVGGTTLVLVVMLGIRPVSFERIAAGYVLALAAIAIVSLVRLDPGAALMELAEVREHAATILDEIERSVVGKRDALELILAALLCDGHVLLEDYPGLAKTLIARSFAQSSSLRFSRIQFTPDLMPSDVTGSSVFDQQRTEFTFLPGPIFTNLLLADEINRAPPKTQAALLEAMQERQGTTEGETRMLQAPVLLMATQNPIHDEGTQPLPEAQLDRFLVRIGVGYPSRHHQIESLSRPA